MQMFTVQEAMKILKLSRSTLYSMRKKGLIRFVKIGAGSLRVEGEELEKLAAAK